MQLEDCLIIDDDLGVCEVLKMYCENLGVFRNILIANDGIIASSMIHNQKFGLILLDINMPKKSGIDVLKDFKHNANPNNIKKVIMISGDVKEESIREIVARGVKHFLVKPFDENSFKEKVTSVTTAGKKTKNDEGEVNLV